MISQENASGAQKLLSNDHHDLDLLLSAVFDALDVSNPVEVLRRLDLFWARLAVHIRAENLRLFPAIADGMEKYFSANEFTADEKSKVDKALVELRGDHDFLMRQLANGVNVMRETTSGYSRNANIQMTEMEDMLTEIRERLKAHNKLEEDIVYRLPAELLDQAKQSALEHGVNQELENLPPRLRDFTGNRGN